MASNRTKPHDSYTVLVPCTSDCDATPSSLPVTVDEIQSQGYMVRPFASDGRWLVEARHVPPRHQGRSAPLPIDTMDSNGAASY